jgi:hypothetical protein
MLAAAILSAAAISTFAWRVLRVDPSHPDRLVGELRLAQWAAVLLAGIAAMSIGLAIAAGPVGTANADAALGVIFVGLAGIILQRDPREALLFVALAFSGHALLDIAHRPGWLAPEVAPRWFTIGCAVYNVYLAAVCYWVRRR